MSPELLPPIAELRRVTQSLAMLDAILSPEWAFRYYSFNSQWGDRQEMASMRNGAGDEWFLLLDSVGGAIKGFAHELATDPAFAQAIPSQVPKDFSSFLGEPAFSMQDATFCYWRAANAAHWSKAAGAAGDDGSDELLALLTSGPSGYKAWADGYYEMEVPLEAVTQIYAHQPLTDAMVLALDPAADLASVYADADEIGYPCALRGEARVMQGR